MLKDLKKAINPSFVCIFSNYYIIGKASWVLEHNDFSNKDSAKLEGLKSMNAIYKKIKQKEQAFDIKFLDSYVRREALNDLMDYVKEHMQDKPNKEDVPFSGTVTIDPGLVAIIQGMALKPDYGYNSGSPIKVGGGGGQMELGVLNRLRGSDGEKISYKLVRSACNSNLYHKINSPDALLDVYKIHIKGTGEQHYLYFDTYHSERVYCPVRLSYTSSN